MATRLITEILSRLPPRAAHRLAVSGLRLAGIFLPAGPVYDDPFEFRGLTFPNRLGLAAGWDKSAECFAPLSRMGFGHVEVGSVTLDRKRPNRGAFIRRLPGQGLLNYLGLPNDGACKVGERLASRPDTRAVVGANIAFLEHPSELVRAAIRLRADYLTINLSCPNHDVQTEWEAILSAVRDVVRLRVPTLVKLSPDRGRLALLKRVEGLLRCGVDGFVATNTTSDHCWGRGGLSGPLLRPCSTAVIRAIREVSDECPVVGAGGVDSAQTYQEKRAAGADLVQIYTSFVYRGPEIIREILEGATR